MPGTNAYVKRRVMFTTKRANVRVKTADHNPRVGETG
jgi:hypothetical protein